MTYPLAKCLQAILRGVSTEAEFDSQRILYAQGQEESKPYVGQPPKMLEPQFPIFLPNSCPLYCIDTF